MDAGGLRAGSHHEHVEHVAPTLAAPATLPLPPALTQRYLVSRGGPGAADVRGAGAVAAAGRNQLTGASGGMVAWTRGPGLINVRACVPLGEMNSR